MGKPKKKFKDTGFGKFINNVGKKAPELLGAAVSIATSPNPVGAAIGQIGSLIRGSEELSDSDKAIFIDQLESQKLAFMQEMETFELEIEDMANAREMQKAALSQGDLFSKRFTYYFALLIFVSAFSLIVMLFFVEVPEENKRIIDMAIGALIATGMIQVIQFFYGSSKGSKDKMDMMSTR